MAQKIVAGNWKMNLVDGDAIELSGAIAQHDHKDVRVILFPPSLFVKSAAASGAEVGVQNFYTEPKGAFTGEISIDQCKSVGANIGLIGHSERREYFNETNAFLKQKVDAAIANDFGFIFCCGEPLEVREAGNELSFVKNQLEESLFHLSPDNISKAVIAYEPIWAIGTGKTASTEQAESMHASIRSWLIEKYSEEVAAAVPILYGGSCKPSNAQELFACPNIDGGLIGGASLVAEDFCAIIDAY